MLTGLLVGLAGKYLPELIGSLTNSDKAEKVAEHVVEVGSTLLGKPISTTSDINELEGVLKSDPTAVLKFKSDLMNKVESIINMELSDAQHARDAAKEDERTGKLMVKMSWLIVVGSYLGILGLIGAAAYIMMNLSEFSQSDSAILMALISAALTQFYNERNQVLGFIYGNKVSSKVGELMGSLSGKNQKK